MPWDTKWVIPDQLPSMLRRELFFESPVPWRHSQESEPASWVGGVMARNLNNESWNWLLRRLRMFQPLSSDAVDIVAFLGILNLCGPDSPQISIKRPILCQLSNQNEAADPSSIFDFKNDAGVGLSLSSFFKSKSLFSWLHTPKRFMFQQIAVCPSHP